MVLGLRSKKKKGASFQIDYVVHVEEIKPWPPSESLRSIQSVLLQWQNGDQNSGSFIAVAGDANIVLNESFTLPLTLQREKKAHDKFQKNFLEFYLYEPRKDKASKEQLLGTAIINLAECGVIEDMLSITAPLNCKKSSKNSVQPALFVHIEPLDKGSSKSSPNVRSSRTSLDQDGQESLADFDGDESEIASFTDDDISSHSSQTAASSTFEAARASPSQIDKNGQGAVNELKGRDHQLSNGSLLPSASLSSDTGKPSNNHSKKSKFPERSMTSVQKRSFVPAIQSSSSFIGYRDINGKSTNSNMHLEQGAEVHGINKNRKPEENLLVNSESIGKVAQKVTPSTASIQVGVDLKSGITNHECRTEVTAVNHGCEDVIGGDEKKQQKNIEQDEEILERILFPEDNLVDEFSHEAVRMQGAMRNVNSMRKALDVRVSNGRLKHVKSQVYDSASRNGLFSNSSNTENATKIHISEMDGRITKSTQGRKEIDDGFPDSKSKGTAETESMVEWESRIKMLEEELRETAALEVGLYSVVTEHGSSMNKVHSPARRLSRFFLHACKANSPAKQASAARAAVSGLVLVSKACGNDVPRLTFWLSNTIMLRAIVSQAAGEKPQSNRPHMEKSNDCVSVSSSSSQRRQDDFSSIEANSIEESDDWEDLETFIFALERTESWVFSRIVESIWWQTLAPHMQTTVTKKNAKTGATSTKKSNAGRYGLGDQEQGNFSVELWKNAFRDACERLCPVRSEGHECGCLPVMARLVMEQLVIRLDVAMFNAILRESTEEMPSDPVSDPITDPRVLPVLAGNLSFGAGAQLKNAIGNWSRWLSDLFDVEDNGSTEDNDILADNEGPASFKPFHLLNALSDIMMLPFEMLTDKTTRREVCPTLGPSLIKKVLSNFVPDQFCPYPIPQSVLDALDDEVASDASTETGTSHPFTAPAPVYSPPPITSLTGFMREVGNHGVQRSGSFLLKKSYTSDDELDELDSRLAYIIAESGPSSAPRKLNWTPKGNGWGKVSRYQLLREVWKDYEQ